MGCDVVVTGAGPADDFQEKYFDNGTWLNEYGMKMRQGDIYVEVAEYPLAHVQTAAMLRHTLFRIPMRWVEIGMLNPL